MEKNDKKLTYIFPGQGSQLQGMGAGLFEKYKEYVKKADDILGYSIEKLCLENPGNCIVNTKYTQPAIYTVSALSYLNIIETKGSKPDFVAGHSLGEYSALFAAGVFDFATGLRIVKKRAELMSTAMGGAMAAILGLNYEEVKEILKIEKFQKIDIANLNTYKQIVISGEKEDLLNVKSAFEKAGALRFAKLDVSGPFHSRYMEPAKKEFEEYLKDFEFYEPQIVVYSNVTAKPYIFSEIKKRLAEQMISSVRWCEIIVDLLSYPENEIIEIGPGRVLTGLTSKIKREICNLKCR